MLPWGHAAVGYLAYSLYQRARHRQLPGEVAVLALAVGTQLPDLVDKPLAWTFGVLPSGRSLGHSVFALVLVGALVVWMARRRDRLVLAGAFLIGWGTHLLGDAYQLLLGEPTCVRYLGWPLAGCPYDEAGRSIIQFFLDLELHAIWPEFALAGSVGLLWVYEGAPGLRYLFEQLSRQSATFAGTRTE